MNPSPPTARRAAAAAGALLLAGALGACSSESSGSSGSAGSEAKAADLPAAPAAEQLGDACGADVVVQLQWQPQSDMGALFSLLGPDYTVDTTTKSVTGTLVVDGASTGTKLTLRAGGPAIGFQSVPSEMYADDSVDFGLVHSDVMIAASGDQRVVAVTPLLTHSPAMLMWDPASQGDDFDITKLADSGATVVVSKDQSYPAWLLSKGYVTEDQLDTGYEGTPARFVADPSIVQQGFANSEPYTYEKDTPAWDKKVDYEMLKDVGYDPYASNLTVRADKLESSAPCLERLVPIVQRASADYVTDPDATNKVIVDVVGSDPSYSAYTIGEATYSSDLLRSEGLIEAENGTVGGYDDARVDAFFDEVAPIIRAQGSKVPDDLAADDLFTNRFVDTSVGMP
ncbi:MAG: hypothetical protein QM572_13260 [Nocardioides sp.]|uniref:hypothetical protein n=1 Tax=Nocardioides sp. TaxID=35761 RepID=UPI0039E498F8